MATGARPLDKISVLEMGQLMAGPFCGTILAWFGANVIKIEPPGGDPVRGWRVLEGGTSLWWRSLARNKRCITLDLRREEGRALARRLALQSDVLLENFRPGTMEGWGLGPEELRRERPALVYARVSGYGQTGPYAGRGGFAAVCEAVGGLRHVTGEPGRPPVRPNLSLGDSLAAFSAVQGVLLALLHRERTGEGQVIDVAITEAVLGVMESALMEAERCGVVREPSGGTITGVVPTNAYLCRDGRRVVIGANADPVFVRLMRAVGRADLAGDPALATNAGRVPHAARLDAAIEGWTRTLDAADVIARLDAARVPAGPVNSVADILADPHFVARGVLEEAGEGGGGGGEAGSDLRLPALGPRLSETPGRTTWPGPDLGAHTEEVLRRELGLTAADVEALRGAGVV